MFGNQLGHKNGVGVGTGDATESPEVTEGACSGVGTEGLRRQYHGRGPHGDGSIALSQVVEEGDERRLRMAAGRGHAGGPTLSVSGYTFPVYSTARQTVPTFSVTAAVKDELGWTSWGITTQELADFYPGGGMTAGWVQGPYCWGSGEGREFAACYK